MNDIRSRLQAQRRALSRSEVERLSREGTHRFLGGCGLPSNFWKGKSVGLYRSLSYELDLKPLEENLRGLGAVLSFPRVIDSVTHQMELATLGAEGGQDPSLWPRAAHGIEEPPSHAAAINPLDLQVVFVPGVAFGMHGERLGMGAGYYDRYLPGAPQALKIALAFDFQLLPKLDQQAWDQKMDWIWTERRHIQLSSGKPG